jgi:hypothetical protein
VVREIEKSEVRGLRSGRSRDQGSEVRGRVDKKRRQKSGVRGQANGGLVHNVLI